MCRLHNVLSTLSAVDGRDVDTRGDEDQDEDRAGAAFESHGRTGDRRQASWVQVLSFSRRRGDAMRCEVMRSADDQDSGGFNAFGVNRRVYWLHRTAESCSSMGPELQNRVRSRLGFQLFRRRVSVRCFQG